MHLVICNHHYGTEQKEQLNALKMILKKSDKSTSSDQDLCVIVALLLVIFEESTVITTIKFNYHLSLYDKVTSVKCMLHLKNLLP